MAKDYMLTRPSRSGPRALLLLLAAVLVAAGAGGWVLWGRDDAPPEGSPTEGAAAPVGAQAPAPAPSHAAPPPTSLPAKPVTLARPPDPLQTVESVEVASLIPAPPGSEEAALIAAAATQARSGNAGAAGTTGGPGGEVAQAPAVASGPAPAQSSPAARAALDLARQLMEKQQYVEARTGLAAAYRSGGFSPADAAEARRTLEQLAEFTIFSPSVHVDDPLAVRHIFLPGQHLEGKSGLVRQMELRVPSQVLLQINRLRSGDGFQAGKPYKLLRGPFHAVVHKSEYALDLYLRDVFVKRYRICIGAPASPTPEGAFRLVLGGKTLKTAYYPPTGSSIQGSVLYPGEAEYPLDPEGHNIKLEGLPGSATTLQAEDGYAIHGTNDPGSIGQAKSLGCIRMKADDIKELYGRLYEYWSTVTIRP